ncbi:MAG: hypothetical protein M1829_006083 [Trizodia sp. TS-e1964]|nr:MAG: hypothetical protein M1829_006083 [Trizodia sp. TS-e1964]
MFPCPKCHKLFNSSTALVQHCESPTNRCKIRESAKYGKTIDTISGGLLETKGRHADGTIKYNAREVNW